MVLSATSEVFAVHSGEITFSALVPCAIVAADIEQIASSKQLPTNQRGTDNAKKHEPNEIHPEDYGVCVAYDQPIAASTK